MSTATELDEDHAAAWSEQDDWTDEALALLRELRAPHRRKRVTQIAYIAYCVCLLLVVWGVLPSMGLFLQTSLGADYTGHGGAVLAAMPAGICALGLGCLLLGARDALWRGPVVPPRDSTDWLLAQPVRIGRVLRPWFYLSCGAWLAAGLLATAIAMVTLGLMAKVGLAAAFGWCLAGGACLPLLAVVLGLAVEADPRAARWVRIATPYATVALLALAGQSALAAAGHSVRWLEHIELWSGPWGWAGLTALSPTPAAVTGGPAAAALLPVLTGVCLVFAVRATGSLSLAALRRRSRTASGVMAALLTAELRTARQVMTSASTAATNRPARLRLPAPSRSALAVPWRDTLALLRNPACVGRAVLLAVIAVLAAVVAVGEHRVTALAATAVALAFGYAAVAQLMEPARLETDDTRRASWSPYPYTNLMLRHAMVPLAVGLLLSGVGAVVVVLLGGGALAWLAPAAVPALVAAALVNACRGATKQHLLAAPGQATGVNSTGPALFLLWYAAGPLAALVLLTVPFLLALHAATGSAVAGTALAGIVVAWVLARWACVRAGKLTS